MSRFRWLPLLFLAACDGPRTFFPTGDIYSLASIDGRPLPAAEPCSAQITVEERVSFYDGEVRFTQRATNPVTGQSSTFAGTGSYRLRGRSVVAELTVTRQDAAQQTYDALLVFERDAEGLTQIAGLPCDGRSVKRYILSGVIN